MSCRRPILTAKPIYEYGGNSTNFGAAIVDIGFWQTGFSADVAAAVPGHILGGYRIFLCAMGIRHDH